MRVVRSLAVILLVVVFGVILYAGWQRHGANRTDIAFVSGGKVELDLSAGGYTIKGSPENRIRVEVDPHEARDVRCQMSSSGNRAKVRIEGPSNNFRATIYVPQRSDLQVDQTVGDLRVENIEGNKRLSLNVGQMQVDVPSSTPAPSFEGSITIGDLAATAWHVEKGGFFRDFTSYSSGPYRISAHVDIGRLEVADFSGQSAVSHAGQTSDADEDVPEQDSAGDSE
jgi:hypothetical protein